MNQISRYVNSRGYSFVKFIFPLFPGEISKLISQLCAERWNLHFDAALIIKL